VTRKKRRGGRRLRAASHATGHTEKFLPTVIVARAAPPVGAPAVDVCKRGGQEEEVAAVGEEVLGLKCRRRR
jgi:hypothetical protein